MKTITKERLLAAMSKLDRWRESELDSLGDLVSAFIFHLGLGVTLIRQIDLSGFAPALSALLFN